MSDNFKWLQFFADGGASGGDGGSGGAGTGVTSADAGQNAGVQAADAGQRLEDLGVPKDKAEKFRQRMAKKKGAGERIATSPSAPRNDNAEGRSAPAAEPAKPNMDFDTFMKIPENQARLQAMMAERGKSVTDEKKAVREQMDKMAPLLELLGSRYQITAENGQYDLDALISAATDDDYFFEDRALANGNSVEKEKSDWKKERAEAQKKDLERRQQLNEHFFKMQQQASDVTKEYPNFDLNRELQNPEFLRLTAPDIGWDVRRAFRAVHQDEIEKSVAEAAARQSMTDAARVVQSGQARPRENGSSAAAVSAAPNLKAMSREERIAYMKAKYPPR